MQELKDTVLADVFEAVKLLETILYASETGNCGVTNGEAILCSAYEKQARFLIDKINK